MNRHYRTTRFNLNQQARIRLVVSMALAQTLAFPGFAHALPAGADVQYGQSGIVVNGSHMQIHQATQKSIINWQSFGIAAGESVQLLQPAQGMALYRVIGPEATQIFGNLSATGSLFLINPSGVLFGQGAQVDVGGLVASTLNISNTDFLSNNHQFTANGSTGSVVNQGLIRAADGGYVVMLGGEVGNSGNITANNGSVVLGSAQSAMLDFYGNGLVKARLSGDALKAVVEQSGKINADGGAVQLTTNARSSAINISGIVQANSLVNRNGVIRLEGGDNARVSVSGTLSAAGNETGTTGGRIEVTGEQVALFKGARLDASGDVGGGTALVGGDYQGKNTNVYNARTTYVDKVASINVDAKTSGDGGKIVVWSDEITRYYGSISAKGGKNGGNGGFAEVSGKRLLNFLGKADLSAIDGLAGNLLLDPLNITLTTVDANTAGFTAPGDITEAFADDAGLTSTFNVNAGGSFAGIAAGSTIILQATNDITVSSAFNVATATGSANNSLVLQANNNINVNAAVTTTGTGAITMTADADANGTGGVTLGANISAATGAVNLSGVTVSGTGNIASGWLKTITTTAGTSTLSGVISGTGALAKAGAGTLTLSGANTYTGATTVSAGTLIGANNTAFGTTAGGVTVANGASLGLQGGITVGAEALTLNGTGVGGAGALRNISGNNTWGGAVTLGSATQINSDVGLLTLNGAIGGATQNLTVNGVGNTTIAGVIGTTTGGLTKNGTGTLILSGNNTYSGVTSINAGTLQLGAANRINNVSAVTVAGDATFNLNSFAEQVGSISGAGNISLGNNATLTAGDTTNTIFSGVISGTGTSGLTKVGTGILTLSGTNTYVGATAINAGTLRLANGAAIADTSAVTLANTAGVTLDLNDTNETIGSLAGGGATGGNVTLGAGTLTAGGNNTSTTYSGVISGTGGITKAGTGTLTLGGVNTYTGATTISAGTLALNATGTIAASSGVANNGNFTIAAAKTIDSITGAGTTVLGANILTIGDASNTNSTYNGIVSGTGGITKAGTGTLTLGGASTYTGATNISAGKLVVTNNTALGTAAGATTVVSGATLALLGGVTVADALTITGNGVGGTDGALESISGVNTYTGAVTLGAGGARINSDAGLFTISGAGNVTGAQPLTVGGAGNTTISKVIATGAGTLTKDGTGTLTLSGANTYTGATNINAGTLTASNATALGTTAGGTIVASGATLNINNVAIGAEAVTISGNGVGSTGALTGTSAASLTGNVTQSAASSVGTTSGASTLALSGTVNAAGFSTTVVGSGNLTATNASNNFATVSVNNANNVSLRDADAIVFGSSNINGNFSLQTAGAITQIGAVTVGGTTTIAAGAANDITLNNAANNFNTVAITSGRDVVITDANALTVNASSVRKMTAQTLSGNLTLGGAITATGTGSGTSINLVSAGNFLNPGNSALTPGAGSRWLVYSTNPTLDTRGAGLLTAYNFKQYNTAFGGPISGTGNGFIYTVAPTITATLGGTAIKTYDGTTTAPVGGLTLGQSGAIDGDTVILSALISADYDNKNAGVNKTVTSNALSITSANNGAKTVYGYQLVGSTANGNIGTINQRAITVAAASDTKTYDGTTSSIGAPTVTSGSIVLGDSGSFSQTFDNKNAGIGKTLTATGSVNDGNGGNNYAVTFVADNTGVINQRILIGSVTANNKTYDGNNIATIAIRTLTGVIGTDDVSYVGGTATFDDKNAGTAKTVVASGLGLSGLDAGNYTVNGAAMTTADIAKANLTLSAQTDAKVYDATTNSTGVVGVSGLMGADTVTSLTQSFASKNVLGVNGSTLNVDGGFTVNDGNGGNNYVLALNSAPGTITPAGLAVVGQTANNKVYDTTTSATLSGGALTGVLGSDAVNLVSGAANFADKNVGNNKAVTVTGTSLSGADAANYTVINPTGLTANITPASLIVSGQTANNKVYDASIAATLSGGALSGVLGSDTVSLVSGTGSFADKNVGNNKAVTVTGTGIAGADAGNYTISDPVGLTANITPASISAVNGITANNKVYDATTGAILNTSSASFIGILGTDQLNVATATGNFADVNAGLAKQVNVSGITLGGADSANYVLTNATATTNADIAARGLTITANAGQSKTVGAADPIFSFTVGGLGLVGADALSGALSRAPGEIVGSYAINQGSLTAGSNYVINFIGDQFTIQAAASLPGNKGNSPSDKAGLGSLLRPTDTSVQSLALLNVAAPGAGGDATEEDVTETCQDTENKRLNNPNTSVIFNFGIHLPKGVKPMCI